MPWKKILPNDWNNLATAYLKRNNYKNQVYYYIIYNYIPGFYSQLGQEKKQPNLRKNIKWKQLREEKITGLKCWFNIKILIWFWLNDECRFYHLYTFLTCWKFSKRFSCSASVILTNIPSTLWTKTCWRTKIKRRARHEKSEFLSKEPSHTCMSVLHEGSSVV